MTVDPEANTVYVPIEDPTDDAYGGARPGNDLFGNSHGRRWTWRPAR